MLLGKGNGKQGKERQDLAGQHGVDKWGDSTKQKVLVQIPSMDELEQASPECE